MNSENINYGAKKWIGIFFISIIIGVAVGMALAGIIYGIYFGITCGLLYVLSDKYGYNIELIILSAILLAGILASIGTSIPWQSLIGIGIVAIYPPFKLLCQVIKEWLEKRRKKREGYQEFVNNNVVVSEKVKTN
jgi:hypothetical protein